MAEAVRAKPKKPKVKSKTKSKTESDDTGLSSPPPLPPTLDEIKSFRGETLDDRVYKTETVEEKVGQGALDDRVYKTEAVEEKAGQVDVLEDGVYKKETVEEKAGQGVLEDRVHKTEAVEEKVGQVDVLDDRVYKTERLQEKEGQSDERDRVKAQQEAFNTRTQDTKKGEAFSSKTNREEARKEGRHEAFSIKTNREATHKDVETETLSCETQKEVENETFSSETHGEETQKDVKDGAISSESVVDKNVDRESDILLKEVLQPRTSDSTKQENLQHPGPIQEERETTHTGLLQEERERTHTHQVVGRERTHADFVQEQREGTLAGHVQEQREVTLALSEMATPSLPLPQNKTEPRLEVRTESHLYPDLPELDTGEDNDPIPVMVRKPEKSEDIDQASNSGCLDTESETQGSHVIPQSTLDDGSIFRDETMTTRREGATVPVTPEEVTKEAQLLLPSLVSHDTSSPNIGVESESHDTVSPNMGMDSQSHDAASPNMDIKSDTTQTVSPNIDVKSYNVNHGQEELRDLSTEATNTAAPNMGIKSKNQGNKELADLSTESTSSNQFVFIQGEESESREETRPKEFSQGASIVEEFAFPSFVELERMRGEREVEGNNFKPMREERRGHLVREVGGANFKPMTFEQLQFLYYNPQLVQSTAFIDQFINSEVKKETHEFHEILMNYYRACRNLLNAEGKVKLLQSEYNQLQDDMWIVTTYSIIAQGLCGDKAKVSTVHSYEQCQLSKDALTNMTSTLQTIRDGIVDNISLFAYSAQLSRLQVESYLNNLFSSCPALREIPKNTPVQAFSHQQLEGIHQVARLKECISVLFTFHRRPSNDQEFTHNIRKWTEILVGCLMRVATFEDHCFILNHVLREFSE